MREYFGLQAILFVTVSDSLVARNLSGHGKKVGYRCPHCFRETDSQYLSTNDQFNGNIERRCSPPHVIGHEVYEMVKDVYAILGK
jgi:hypothetical protein